MLSGACMKIKVDFSEVLNMDDLKPCEWLGLYLIGEVSASKMCEIFKIDFTKWKEFEINLYKLIIDSRLA